MLHSSLQVVAVFDADQVARPNFFTRTLPWLQDGRESVVLTPQYFHNFDVQTDIFSHRQAGYWNMILPGQVGRASVQTSSHAVHILMYMLMHIAHDPMPKGV